MGNPLKGLQVLNITGVAAVIILNMVAIAWPLNDRSMGKILDQYETLLTPAPYTFTVWIFIYTGLIAFAIYQSRGLLEQGRTNIRPVVGAVGVTFFINCLANVAWVYAWHFEQFHLSVLLMAVLLLSLIDIFVKLSKMDEAKNNRYFRWCVWVPFGIYLGWICIFFMINVAVYLDSIEWSGLGISQRVWTSGVLILEGLAGVWMAWKYRATALALAIAWGIMGIYTRLYYLGEYGYVRLIAVISVLLIAVGVFRVLRKRNGEPEIDRIA